MPATTQARYRVFFGHQSVGENLIQGLRCMGNRVPIVDTFPNSEDYGLWHNRLGQNARPESKLQDFADKLKDGTGTWCEMALMKLCYVDITARTDVEQLWKQYEKTMSAIRAQVPKLKLLHVTVPLNRTHTGLKGFLISMLRPQPRMDNNLARERFNNRLRDRYNGLVFDLARLEATAPDGRLCTVIHQGSRVPSLCSSYTHDGGHLNASGRDHIARAFAQFLEEHAGD